MTVLNALKPGLHEKLYENALIIELQERGHIIEQQKSFPVHYKNRLIGNLIPDLIIDEKVIVDLKVVEAFNESNRCPNDRLSCPNRTQARHLDQLQTRKTTMETNRKGKLKNHRYPSA